MRGPGDGDLPLVVTLLLPLPVAAASPAQGPGQPLALRQSERTGMRNGEERGSLTKSGNVGINSDFIL